MRIVDNCTSILQMGGPLAGVLLVLLESILPMLPLGVFITLNIKAFGFVLGFIISWGATCLGCYLAYRICNSFLNEFILKRIPEKKIKKIDKLKDKIKDIPFSNLVVIIALPFTPAFLINICAGFANITKKKFLLAILIGKIAIVYFWGFVGTSLLDSMTDLKTICIIAVMLVVAYILSKYVSKKAHIK